MNGRRWLRLAGLALSAAAVVWIAVRFARSGALDQLANAGASLPALIMWVLACATVYAIAGCVLAVAWWRLAVALAARPLPVLPIATAYAVSQYGKYLPGNVMHFAIRHAWSRRYDVSHAALVLASILEAALLVLAALGLTLFADARELPTMPLFDPRFAIALLVALFALLGIALRMVRGRRVLARFQLPPLPSTGTLLACLACYLVFLLVYAALLDALAHVLGIKVDSFAMLLGAAAASWLAGFVVVGAPGGLGVREAAFVALAGAALGESRALLLIGAFRVVTFLGDTLFFGAGAFLAHRNQRVPKDMTAPPVSQSRERPT